MNEAADIPRVYGLRQLLERLDGLHGKRGHALCQGAKLAAALIYSFGAPPFFSVEWLADKLGVAESTARGYVADLEKARVVKRIYRRNAFNGFRSNEYRRTIGLPEWEFDDYLDELDAQAEAREAERRAAPAEDRAPPAEPSRDKDPAAGTDGRDRETTAARTRVFHSPLDPDALPDQWPDADAPLPEPPEGFEEALELLPGPDPLEGEPESFWLPSAANEQGSVIPPKEGTKKRPRARSSRFKPGKKIPPHERLIPLPIKQATAKALYEVRGGYRLVEDILYGHFSKYRPTQLQAACERVLFVHGKEGLTKPAVVLFKLVLADFKRLDEELQERQEAIRREGLDPKDLSLFPGLRKASDRPRSVPHRRAG